MCVCETKPCAIGVGAQGSVWKYRRSSDKTFVAIKKVSSRSRFDASWRMSGEAAVMSLFAKNGSQHVIPFYGSFVDCDGFINLSMKYLGKGSLADLLSSHHRLLTPAVSILGLHLLSALDYFHNDLNLLHRDIKPSNIMIEDDGRFVLADLALAILTSAGSPADNSLAGTIHYMSPECLIDGVASPASDLWSFGMVLLEALLGYSPLDKVASVVSGGSTSATESDFVSESTMEYWRQHHIITNVKSPIYLPSVRQELDALSRAFDVNVLDFFDRCLHPVRAQALHFLSPWGSCFLCLLFSCSLRRILASARLLATCCRMSLLLSFGETFDCACVFILPTEQLPGTRRLQSQTGLFAHAPATLIDFVRRMSWFDIRLPGLAPNQAKTVVLMACSKCSKVSRFELYHGYVQACKPRSCVGVHLV
jgi:serine/threonine protein kinase